MSNETQHAWMQLAALYPRRIGVAAQEVHLSAHFDNLADIIANSEPVSRLGRAQERVIERMRDKSLWTPAPSTLPRGSSFCADDVALVRRIAQAEGVLDAVTAAAQPGNVAAWELGDAKKLTFQRGYPSYWDVPAKPLINVRSTGIATALQAIIARYGANPPPAKVNPVRRHTNHGGFDQSTSDASALLHAAITAYAFADTTNWQNRLEEGYALVASKWSAIEKPHCTEFSRTGPMRKHQALRAEVGGRVVGLGTFQGYAPRRRPVYGPPLSCNIALRAGYDALASIVVNAGLWHGTEDDILVQLRRFWADGQTLYNDDISSFDTNVSRDDQEALAHAATTKWPHLRHAWDAWLYVERLPILAGPILAGEKARLHHMDGQTTSGVLFTSLVGTIINFARCVTIRSVLQKSSIADVLDQHDSGRALTMNWGDDTIISGPADLATTEWDAASAELGFPCELGRGAAFLKKWYTPLRWMPSATRAFQQTVWNEHGGRTGAIEVFGLYARTKGVEHNPLWRAVERYIFDGMKGTSLDEWRVTSLADLRRVVTTPMFMEAFRVDVKAHPFILQDKLIITRASTEAEEVIGYAAALMGRTPELDSYAAIDQLRPPSLTELGHLATLVYNSEAAADLPPKWAAALTLIQRGQPNGNDLR